MKWRAQNVDEFEVNGVADRLAPYGVSPPEAMSQSEVVGDDLVEKAVTLLKVMPRNQRRETVEDLLSPNDPPRGRRAVDALIGAAFAVEDELGRLRRIVGSPEGMSGRPPAAPQRAPREDGRARRTGGTNAQEPTRDATRPRGAGVRFKRAWLLAFVGARR
jgi:hypothetical protein